MRFLVVAVALAGALAACQTKPVAAPDVASQRNIRATVAYHCDDETVFTAAFLVSPEAADLHFPNGDVLRLAQEVSGSGFRYGDGKHELQGKGDEALYSVGKAAPTKCYVSK